MNKFRSLSGNESSSRVAAMGFPEVMIGASGFESLLVSRFVISWLCCLQSPPPQAQVMVALRADTDTVCSHSRIDSSALHRDAAGWRTVEHECSDQSGDLESLLRCMSNCMLDLSSLAREFAFARISLRSAAHNQKSRASDCRCPQKVQRIGISTCAMTASILDICRPKRGV